TALPVPHQVQVDVGDALFWRQPPQALLGQIVRHDVLRQAADPIARKHEPLDLVQARRRGDDAAGESLLIAKHRERRQRIAQLVAHERDKVFAEQVTDRQARPPEQPMVPPAEHGVALAQEQLPLQLFARRAAQAEPNAGALLGEGIEDVRAAHDFHLQIHARVMSVKRRQAFVVHARLDAADGQQMQHAAHIVLRFAKLRAEPRDIAIDVGGDAQYVFADAREAKVRATPLDERVAKLIFEPPQREADRRLRDVQPHRRTADAALVDDGEKGAQQ
ncbi:inorganic polyphosphate/ATP-NAD kinase, partial [Corchorus olitorius]